MARIGKRNLKEQVLALRQEGKTLIEIKSTLRCSFSTIAYHLYQKTRTSTKQRVNRENKNNYNRTYVTENPKGILIQKYTQFFRLGKYSKISDAKKFTFQDLVASIPDNPKCYLTGQPLNLSSSSSFSFDHKIPTSKGGTLQLDNLGLCSSIANRAKSDMLELEFVDLCKQVLTHHGFTVSKI